jgi:hypothetical protein
MGALGFLKQIKLAIISIIDYRFLISVSKNDEDHLKLVRNLLESTNPIKNYLIKNSKKNPKWNDVWESKLLITSKQIANDLIKFNIVPKKSLIYTFPKWLEKHPLKHHFMRGYFDGDGSFFINSELSNNRLCSSIRGTEKFLKTYKKILQKDCSFKCSNNIDYHNKKLHNLDSRVSLH